jgi:hypothetical protein
MQFIEELKRHAYKNLDIKGHIVDTHGWMSKSFEVVVSRSVSHLKREDPLTVVEVGTWKGLSASKMVEVLKKEGFTNFNVICIDTWLGAPEFWTWGINDPTRGLSLKRVDGYPSVFHTFTKNVKVLGMEDHIAPLPLSSTQAADVLAHYKIRPDLIYIDASHEFNPVTSDISCYYPLLKDGCVMLGDDYSSNWKGVIKAVDTFVAQNKLELTVNDVVWSFKKPSM